MRTRLLVLGLAGVTALVLGSLSPAGAATSYPAPTVGTKIADRVIGDPALLATSNGDYLYATGQTGIDVYKSTQPGSGYSYDRTISFKGYTKQWAPHVVRSSGRYVLFFTAVHGTAEHCVDVAASAQPDRGFTPYGSLKCDADISQGWEAIDPTTYASSSGHYLVWRRGKVSDFPGGQYQIMAESITYHATGKPATLTAGKSAIALTPIQKTVIEAPSLIFRNNKLWLFVSRGAYNMATGTTAYYTQVWQAAKLGPLSNAKTVMTSGAKYGYGPGAAEVDAINGTVYIAYEYIASTSPLVRHVDIATVSWKTGPPMVQ